MPPLKRALEVICMGAILASCAPKEMSVIPSSVRGYEYFKIMDDPAELIDMAYAVLKTEKPTWLWDQGTIQGIPRFRACYDVNGNGNCEMVVDYLSLDSGVDEKIYRFLRFPYLNKGIRPVVLSATFDPDDIPMVPTENTRVVGKDRNGDASITNVKMPGRLGI